MLLEQIVVMNSWMIFELDLQSYTIFIQYKIEMSKVNEFMHEQNEAINHILKSKNNPQTIEEQVIKSLLLKSSHRVQQQIIQGQINIFDPNKIVQQIDRIKAQRKQKESRLDKISIEKQQQEFKKLKRQIIKLKQQQNDLVKKQSHLKSKQIIDKVKKWQEIQEQIKSKKEKEDQQKRKLMNEESLKQKKQQMKMEAMKKAEKKKKIMDKLKKLEEYRLNRQQIIKFSQNQYSKLNPKYLQIQKKFKQIQQQLKFQEEIYKKNHKLNNRIDHTSLKTHEKNYMTQVQQRQQKRKSLKSPQNLSQSQYSPFFFRNQEKIQQQLQKLKRRRQFQQKLKEIPIKVDGEKRKKIQIAIDKGKNPLKYHFLSEKALDEEKIYSQFQDFQININPRDLGKQYLKQLPALTQNSRITKSQSLNTLGDRQSSVSNRYRDYLQDLKSQRSVAKDMTDEQMMSLARSKQNNSKIIERLDERAKKYDLQLKKKKQELDTYNALQSSSKKAKQMDKLYMKSIQAKLACIQINT